MTQAAGQQSRRVRSIAIGVGRAVFSIAIVAVLIGRSNPAELVIRPDARLLIGFGAAIAMILLALYCSAIRWKLVLGAHAPRASALWRLYLIGWFFSLFLPTSVGGDAARTVALVRSRTPAGAALSSVVLERLLGVAALCALLLAGLVVAPSTPVEFFRSLEWNVTGRQLWLGSAGFFALLGVLGLLAARSHRVRGLVRDALALVMGFRDRPGALAAAILVSITVQTLYVLTWITLAWAVRLDAPLAPFLVYVPFISIAAMLPVTLAGLGLREGAWALLLAPLGIATATAVSFSLLYYAAGLVVGLAGAALFLTSGLRTELQAGIADDGDHVRSAAVTQSA